MSERLKKHLSCSPNTLEELKKHIEYGKCYPIVSKEFMYDLILRIQAIEEELE